jgi:multiple sugar transport system permease protein
MAAEAIETHKGIATRDRRAAWWRFGVGMSFLSPWLVGLVVMTLIPLGLTLYYSLCTYSLLLPPRFVGLQNYAGLWHDDVFWHATRNTFYFAAMVLPSGLVVSLGLALLLNVDGVPGRGVWRTVIFMPCLVPVVSSALLWVWLLNGRLGLINVLLGHVGIAGPAWLADPRWAMPALVLMSLWGTGNAVVIYLAGLGDVPAELYEAAQLDGAGVAGRIRHVTLPTLSPVIFFNTVMGMIAALQTFDAPNIMTNGGPAHATYMLSMYLYDNAFAYLRMGYASAIAWVLMLIVVAVTALTFWSSRYWVHYANR